MGRWSLESPRHERAAVVALLLLHVCLVLWGVVRNSITYDETFHVSSGVLLASRGDASVSTVNPPLVKVLSGAAAIAAGAKLPPENLLATRDQRIVGDSFMRSNAARYSAIVTAARLPVVVLSILLCWLVWRLARRLYGRAGGLFAVAVYSITPEVLAHAGVATMDLATGLGFLATLAAWDAFVRRGGWSVWALVACAFAATTLTRFTSWILLPILFLSSLALFVRRDPSRASPARVLAGLALLVPAAIAALAIGYRGGVSAAPFAETAWQSVAFRSLADQAPWLRVPLPDLYLQGFDWQAAESEAGVPAFVNGRVVSGRVWWYFPYAILLKWPLGLLGALALRAALGAARAFRAHGEANGARFRRYLQRDDVLFLLVPAAVFLAGGMFLTKLTAGVRYVFPLVPMLAVWLGGLPRALGGGKLVRGFLVALPAVVAIETMTTAPYYLSFFNLLAGGPGRGDRLINDSNADWGQGLLALRDELRRRGIGKVYLTYHGTADPAVYGIDYIPYTGGAAGGESAWLAVSSYYFRGLSQRMVTSTGISAPVRVDFRALWDREPEARPGRCMRLYHLPNASAP